MGKNLNFDEIEKAYDYCEGVTKLHARSFYFAARFLPRPKQRAVFPIYAFCRHVDDEIDEIGGTDEKTSVETVEKWKTRLREVYQLKNEPGGFSNETNSEQPTETKIPESGIRNPKSEEQRLVLLAWRDLLKTFPIPVETPLELVEGVLMDTKKNRYQTFEDLYLYCYRVASTVGLMSSEILGYSDKKALEYAEALGIGMQLTNILRDVKEDAAIGRIYLPREDLEEFDVSEEQIFEGNFDSNFRRLIRFQIERARNYYRIGERGIALLEKDSRFTVLLASRIYGKILNEIEKLDCNVFRQRAHTTKVQKLLAIPGIWLRSKRIKRIT
ncbi:MAG: phytoene/squalene synthase family protein [Pyrinomonadaceae bacterium]